MSYSLKELEEAFCMYGTCRNKLNLPNLEEFTGSLWGVPLSDQHDETELSSKFIRLQSFKSIRLLEVS